MVTALRAAGAASGGSADKLDKRDLRYLERVWRLMDEARVVVPPRVGTPGGCYWPRHSVALNSRHEGFIMLATSKCGT